MIRTQLLPGSSLPVAGMLFCFSMWTQASIAQSPGPLTPLPARTKTAISETHQPNTQPVPAAQPDFEQEDVPEYNDSVSIRTTSDPNSPLVAEFRAGLKSDNEGRGGVIQITVQLAQGCHLYSLTQKGPRQTRIDVAESEAIEISGPARAARLAEVSDTDGSDPVESYSDQITFFVPVQILNPDLIQQSRLLVRINGLICSDEGFCLPVRDKILWAPSIHGTEPDSPLDVTRLPNQETGQAVDR